MNDHYLVYGCGDLAWASREPNPPLPDDWRYGRLDEILRLDPYQDGASAPTVSLAEELDARIGWVTAQPQNTPQTRIANVSAFESPLLPSWDEIVARKAEEVTLQRKGAGVLVTPESYRDSAPGRSFLAAWAKQGWRWAGLEAVLARHAPPAARWVSASGCWLRVREPEGSAVVPNGIEAALAIDFAGPLLELLLDAVPSELATAWQAEEQPRSGWFTRQQLVLSLREALRRDQPSLDLGGPEAPLFAFSSPEARDRFRPLGDLWLAVSLPRTPARVWWEQIAQSGLLRAPGGKGRLTGLRWDSLETILVDHPKEEGTASPTTDDLQTYLRFNQRRQRLLSVRDLRAAIGLGSDLTTQVAAWQRDETRRELAGLEPEVTGLADPLDGFELHALRLQMPFRSGSLKVWIDGQRLASDNVALEENNQGERTYHLREQQLRHGQVVRVDYEPGGVES